MYNEYKVVNNLNFELMKNKRKELGMTQQELADKCGLSKTTIFNYESGRFEPTKENIKILSKVLNIPEADLLANNLEVEKLLTQNDVFYIIKSMRNNLIMIIRDKLITLGKLELCLIDEEIEKELGKEYSKQIIEYEDETIKIIDEIAEEYLEFLERNSCYRMVFSKKLEKVILYENCRIIRDIKNVKYIEKEVFLLLIENINSLIDNTIKIAKKNKKMTDGKREHELIRILVSEKRKIMKDNQNILDSLEGDNNE